MSESGNNTMKNCIPESFSKRELRRCPLCGAVDMGWEISDSWSLLDRYYYFQCNNCGSVLKIPQSDVTGLSFTTNNLVGQMKKMKKKDSRKVYVKIERVGLKVKQFSNLVGLEAPLDEMVNMLKNQSE